MPLLCHCETHPPFVVRPFRVVQHEAKASHYILEHFCHCEAWFKNVVAQFIGQLCLMNQATTKSGGEATWTDTLQGKS